MAAACYACYARSNYLILLVLFLLQRNILATNVLASYECTELFYRNSFPPWNEDTLLRQIRAMCFTNTRKKYFGAKLNYYANSNSIFQLIRISTDGDIAKNPGPTDTVERDDRKNENSVKRVCVSCNRSLRKNQNGVECSSCRNLFHQKCSGMSRKELNKNVRFWCCFTCLMPQITDSFFEDSAETCSLNSSTTNDELIPDSIEWFYSNINSYYMSNIKIAHLNINSIQNKLDEAKNMLNRNMFDILFIGETKLDDTFPANLLQHPGY